MDEKTRLIRAGSGTPDGLSRTVGPPIQKGSTVLMPDAASLYDSSQVTYGRSGLAAQNALMTALCELEGASAVRLFPSGLAAITGAVMALVKTGDEVLVTDAAYKPTRRFCENVLAGRLGVGVRYFAPDATAVAVMSLATERTRLILLESPGSLTFEMQDVPAVAALARSRGILTLLDNTWAAGLYFKPLEHGVDLSVQALTKYVGGHSDVFMGSVAVSDERLALALNQGVIDFGWSVSSEDAYMMLRGLRTLPTRMARHGETSLAVAAWLREQPEVLEVLHPALPGARGHDLFAATYTGAPGLFSIVLEPRPLAAVHAFLNALHHFGLGFSWGGFESLALDCDPQFNVRQVKPAFPGPLIRLNVGLEDAEDLIGDLAGALGAYKSA